MKRLIVSISGACLLACASNPEFSMWNVTAGDLVTIDSDLSNMYVAAFIDSILELRVDLAKCVPKGVTVIEAREKLLEKIQWAVEHPIVEGGTLTSAGMPAAMELHRAWDALYPCPTTHQDEKERL